MAVSLTTSIPVALMDAAKKSTASVTGRMATAEEQQAFVKMVHGLQASGATGINVGARAEAFAREQAPEEARRWITLVLLVC